MCHTTLQHYIHCRHTNLTFQHCHLDIHPWDPHARPVSSHPNYYTLPASTSAGEEPTAAAAPVARRQHDDPAAWRSHDTLQGVAHAYRRRCPACVKEEIRQLVRREKEEMRRQGGARGAVAEWRAFANSGNSSRRRGGGSGAANNRSRDLVDDDDDGGSGGGGAGRGRRNVAAGPQRLTQQQVDYGAADGDGDGGAERRAVVAWQQYAERGLAEEERRVMRDRMRRRRRRLVSEEQEEDRGSSGSVTPTPPPLPEPRAEARWLPLTAAPDEDTGRPARRGQESRAGSRRRSFEWLRQRAQQVQAPPTIEPQIDFSGLGPRVRQRQLDLMEQARLYELQIWAQRAEDGGLTEQQRALVARGPLLATIPEERRREVERQVGEREAAEEGEIVDEGSQGEQVGSPRRGSSSLMGTYSSLGMARGQIDGTDERAQSRVRFAGEPDDWTPRTLRVVRRTGEDTLLSDGQVLPATTYAADFASGETEPTDDRDRNESASVDHRTALMPADGGVADLAPGASTTVDQSADDMPVVPVERPTGEHREAWELLGTMAAAPDDSDTLQAANEDDHDSDESDSAGTARVNCPCHEAHTWTTVSSQPTHSHIEMHKPETLAQQRDSPLHRSMPSVAGSEPEELSDDMWEILVAFEACGHSLAIFVTRLEYENASQIRATCGCYGFDRCLVAARRATSARECLMCRMQRERETWALRTGREATERCPWFERYVRLLEGSRDWALWPFGARDNRVEL